MAGRCARATWRGSTRKRAVPEAATHVVVLGVLMGGIAIYEGPQRIAKTGTEKLLAGMILSNEPGYYRGGEGRKEGAIRMLRVLRAPGPPPFTWRPPRTEDT